MNSLLKKLAGSAADAGSFVRSLADSGLRSVNEVFRGTKIFGALSASASEQAETDETHYVLVPLPGAEREYAIYTKRILPPGTGVTNSLPKARIFHVPDESGKALLERKLIDRLAKERLDQNAGSSDLADTLDKVADQIDRQTDKISGGLLLIGGAVALANPLLGIGIVVKGLLPSIGAKATKAGADYFGGKLRARNRATAESDAKEDAAKEVGKLKPQLYENPVIRSMEAIAANPATDFDPVLDQRNWIDEFKSLRHYEVTAEAIREVYTEILNTGGMAGYQDTHIRWIRSFADARDT
jgi:hypothetical protein